MPVLETSLLDIGYIHNKNKNIVQSTLSLQLKAGEMVCLIGPNGVGKSTLLRTISGLQKPLRGKVSVHNKNIQSMSPHKKAQLIALVLTDRVDIDNAKVEDIVSLGRYPYQSFWKNTNNTDNEAIEKAIALVHLEEKRKKYLNELSDGERQRVMIAKALAQDTPIIMLDEPTAHLDLPNRVEIMLLLHTLAHQTGKSILLSTHELDLALQAADRIWLMSQGGVEAGVPEDLVFNGSFNKTFESKSYFFNASNGNFSMNYPLTKKVQVEGDATRMYWTFRALARAGFSVEKVGKLKIEITDKAWIVADNELKSIEELLNFLNSKF